MCSTTTNNKQGIGTLRENSLHASLKDWIAKPTDKIEIEVDGYFIDIVRGDLLIEIQTGNFGHLKTKFKNLLEKHEIQLVYPLQKEKWIVREETTGEIVNRRKSPKRGRLEDFFREAIRIPKLLANPNLKTKIIFVQIEEIWRNDGRGSWRRKYWSITDQRLLKVIDQEDLNTLEDYRNIIPKSLPTQFTNQELAAALNIQASLASKMSYTLRKMNIIKVVGKRGNAHLHEVSLKKG
jgi:hypothetical protein